MCVHGFVFGFVAVVVLFVSTDGGDNRGGRGGTGFAAVSACLGVGGW